MAPLNWRSQSEKNNEGLGRNIYFFLVLLLFFLLYTVFALDENVVLKLCLKVFFIANIVTSQATTGQGRSGYQ